MALPHRTARQLRAVLEARRPVRQLVRLLEPLPPTVGGRARWESREAHAARLAATAADDAAALRRLADALEVLADRVETTAPTTGGLPANVEVDPSLPPGAVEVRTRDAADVQGARLDRVAVNETAPRPRRRGTVDRRSRALTHGAGQLDG